jgi:NADPH-dependent curcumin reductase CurA
MGRPQAGDTGVVAGVAGATGSIAGQSARLHGCRVIPRRSPSPATSLAQRFSGNFTLDNPAN